MNFNIVSFFMILKQVPGKFWIPFYLLFNVKGIINWITKTEPASEERMYSALAADVVFFYNLFIIGIIITIC